MRLNHVTVPALDLGPSIAFYQKLGFHLIVESPHYARFEIGDETLSVQLREDVSMAGNGPHIYLECDDVDATVAQLKASGLLIDREPADERWLWREAWLTDPAGTKICLFHAGENRRYPPWRLTD